MVSHDEAPSATAPTAVSGISTAGDVAPDPCPYVTAASFAALATSVTSLLTMPGAGASRAPIDGTPDARATIEAILAALRERAHGALFGPLTAYGSAEHAAALKEALGHLQRVISGVRRFAASASRAQRIVGLADIEPTALAALEAASECVFAPDGYQYETFPHFFELLHSAAQLFLLLDGDTQACQSAGDLAQLTAEAAQSLPAAVGACTTFHARAESYLHDVYQAAFGRRMAMVGQDYTCDLDYLTVVDRALARSLSETVPRTDATEAATFALAKATGYRIARAYADTLLVREAAHLLNAVFNRSTEHVGEYCRPALRYTDIATMLAFHNTVEPEGVAAARGQNLGSVKALAKPDAIALVADELGRVPAPDDALGDLVTEHRRVRSRAAVPGQTAIQKFAGQLVDKAVKTYLPDSRLKALKKASPLKFVFAKGAASLAGPLVSAGIGVLFSAMFPKTELTKDVIKDMIGEALSEAFARHNLDELILNIQAYDRAAGKSADHIAAVGLQNASDGIVLPAYERACDVVDRAFKNMSSDPSNIKTHIDSRIYTLSMWLEAVDCMLKEAAICLQAKSLETIHGAIVGEVRDQLGKCTNSFKEIVEWINNKIWENWFDATARQGYFPRVFWFLSGDTIYDRKDWPDHVIAHELSKNYGKVQQYCARFTASHVMNYLQLRNIQDNLDGMVAAWNETFGTYVPNTGGRATFWFNKNSADLKDYAEQTLKWRGDNERKVQQVVNLGPIYKLGDYPKGEADWSCYLIDERGQKRYLPPGSHADLTVFGSVETVGLGLGLGLRAFLWTEKQFGIDSENPEGRRKGAEFSFPDDSHFNSASPPLPLPARFYQIPRTMIRSAVIAYDFKRWYRDRMTWIPKITVVGNLQELTLTAEPPDLVDFKLG
jgi:hypothetical protein